MDVPELCTWLAEVAALVVDDKAALSDPSKLGSHIRMRLDESGLRIVPHLLGSCGVPVNRWNSAEACNQTVLRDTPKASAEFEDAFRESIQLLAHIGGVCAGFDDRCQELLQLPAGANGVVRSVEAFEEQGFADVEVQSFTSMTYNEACQELARPVRFALADLAPRLTRLARTLAKEDPHLPTEYDDPPEFSAAMTPIKALQFLYPETQGQVRVLRGDWDVLEEIGYKKVGDRKIALRLDRLKRQNMAQYEQFRKLASARPPRS